MRPKCISLQSEYTTREGLIQTIIHNDDDALRKITTEPLRATRETIDDRGCETLEFELSLVFRFYFILLKKLV